MSMPPDLSRLAGLFNAAPFWVGCIAARCVEDRLRHDDATVRLQRLLSLAESGGNVMADPEFARWLAY